MSQSVFTLPPAPNWFSGSLVSSSPVGGWVVYGAKNYLVLLNHQTQAVEDSSKNLDCREKSSVGERVEGASQGGDPNRCSR